jgi:hypothetical protein
MAVDPRRAGEQAVAGRARDQVIEVAPLALRGDREAPVFDPGPGIDQVVDVLPGGAPAPLVTLGDRLRPGGILGQRPPPQQLGELGFVCGRLGDGDIFPMAPWSDADRG